MALTGGAGLLEPLSLSGAADLQQQSHTSGRSAATGFRRSRLDQDGLNLIENEKKDLQFVRKRRIILEGV